MQNRKLLSFLTVLFIALVGMRFNVAFLAWVMFVPLLLLVRRTDGLKGWLWVGLLLQAGFLLQVAKIITDPIPPIFAPMFSVPAALGTWLVIWIFEKMRRRIGELPGVFFFAALMSVSEWLTYTTSQMGSWGAMAYTQVDNLALLQSVSLLGITLPAFFIYLSSAFTALFIAHKKLLYLKPAVISFVLYALLYGYGVWRVHRAAEGKHLSVAAITGTMEITPEGFPDQAYLTQHTHTLLSKTGQAIRQGARLIAWNEGATVIMPEQEPAFVEKLKSISSEGNVTLIAAYIVPIDGLKKFENKYLFIHEGKVYDEYFKRHPVPGEGAIKGEKAAKTVNTGDAKVSGAICYDFDFPALGRQLARNGNDLVVLPSSDWQGIDPIHAQMATVRAVEGGYALLRPVRGATSIAVDGYGRVRASMSYFEDNSHIMMASLPMQRVETLYTKTGDVFVYLLMLFLGGVSVMYVRNFFQARFSSNSYSVNSAS